MSAIDAREFQRRAAATRRTFRRARLPGFSHSGVRSWRIRDDGLVDLVQFQTVTLGTHHAVIARLALALPDPPPGSPEPECRRGVIVNLGVWIPDVTRFERGAKSCRIPPDIASCHAQARLIRTASEPCADVFSVDHDTESCAAELGQAWDAQAAGFFGSYPDRESFLRTYLAGRPALSIGESARHLVILLGLHRRSADARRVMELATADGEHPAFARSLAELARRVGV